MTGDRIRVDGVCAIHSKPGYVCVWDGGGGAVLILLSEKHYCL